MVAPAYQFIANGLYEVIWGISISANVVARQGYVEPSSRATCRPAIRSDTRPSCSSPTSDDFRLPTVTSLDGRVEKKFVFGSSKVAVDFDVFNLLNQGTVLGKQYDARLTGPTGFGQVLEIMNPRIARLGVRFTF